MKPNHVKNSDFMSIFFTVNHSEISKYRNLEMEKEFAKPSMI